MRDVWVERLAAVDAAKVARDQAMADFLAEEFGGRNLAVLHKARSKYVDALEALASAMRDELANL